MSKPNQNRAIERLLAAINNIKEEGSEDVAAWEHRAHLQSALEATQRGDSDWIDQAEDALGEDLRAD